MTPPDTLPAGAVLAVPPALEPLVRAIAASPQLQARLGPSETPDDFVAIAGEVAAELGLHVDETALRRALVPDPLGLGRWGEAPVTLSSWPEGDWLPTRSVPIVPPQFEWAWFGGRKLTEPFYEDSVRRDGTRPMNLLLRTRTAMEAMIAGAEAADCVPLSGLIFHMSRCGSTLLARMLGAVPRYAVASEPEPLDAVLQWARLPGVAPEEAIAAVRAMVAALGRRRDSVSQRFFIKLDAWHTLSLPLLRAAFPDVPWVYLYRDPVEVMVSQMNQPGIHMVPGGLPATVMTIPSGEQMSREEFSARVLARVGDAVVRNWALGGGRVVRYQQIRDSLPGRISDHFGLTLDTSEVAAIDAVAGADAKYPDAAFVFDSQRKQVAASDRIRAAVTEHLTPVHEQLAVLERR